MSDEPIDRRPAWRKTWQSTWDARQASLQKMSQLRQSLAARQPELIPKVDELTGKMQKHAGLLQKLRYSLEFRAELKRMALTPEQIRGVIPSRDTRFGQPALYVIGVKDQEGKEHLFLRPIRTDKL